MADELKGNDPVSQNAGNDQQTGDDGGGKPVKGWDGKPIDPERVERLAGERNKWKKTAAEQARELEELRQYREAKERESKTDLENLQTDNQTLKQKAAALENEKQALSRELLATRAGAVNPAYARWHIEQELAKNPDQDPEAILLKMAEDQPEQFTKAKTNGDSSAQGGEADGQQSGSSEQETETMAAAQGGAGSMAKGGEGMTLQEINQKLDDLAKSGIQGKQYLRQRFNLLRARDAILHANQTPDQEAAAKFKEEGLNKLQA